MSIPIPWKEKVDCRENNDPLIAPIPTLSSSVLCYQTLLLILNDLLFDGLGLFEDNMFAYDGIILFGQKH